jgi:hypothetical protein
MDAANATVVKLQPGSKVQNIVGSTAGALHPSAKHFWKKAMVLQGHRQEWPAECCIRGCHNSATHGSHVKLYAHSNWGWYLIPTCHLHNKPRSSEVRRHCRCHPVVHGSSPFAGSKAMDDMLRLHRMRNGRKCSLWQMQP